MINKRFNKRCAARTFNEYNYSMFCYDVFVLTSKECIRLKIVYKRL